MAALLQGGAAAAAAAYVAYDLLSGPRILRDEEVQIVLSGLVNGARMCWSAEDGCLYVCDSWGGKVWGQRLEGPSCEVVGNPELLLQSPPGAREPVAVLRHSDGRLLVALAGERQIVAVDPAAGPGQEAPVVGDVTAVDQSPVIDFVHDDHLGGVYCSHLGTQVTYSYLWEEHSLAKRASMPQQEDQGPWVAAGGLYLPLGLACSADGRTLVCTQLHTFHLWALDRDPDSGNLSNFRIWAELPGAYCHGLCLDAEGCAWVAVVGSRDDAWTWNCLAGGPAAQYYKKWATGAPASGFVRVRQGGKVLQRVMLRSTYAVGCTLGGPDGHTLFMGISEMADGQYREFVREGNSFVAALRVPVGAPGSAHTRQSRL